MLKKILYSCTIVFLFNAAYSQETSNDSLAKSLDEVVITATRTERKLSNVAIPVTIIQQKTILQNGSLRLKELLSEQTGLQLTSGFGSGVQMQGLSPDYTMILIDGEPLVGRTAGVLDLSRITAANIKKIEIVKGPSSSLYGSEAMAGVINIITEKSPKKKLQAGLRYGTYNTFDANLSAGGKVGKLTVNAFINNYNTNGYSLRPNSVERAISPIWRLTNQLQLQYPVTERTKISVTARYNYEDIKNTLSVTNGGQTTVSKGLEVNKDFNLNPVITHQFNDKLKTALRFYATLFEGTQKLITTNNLGYNDVQHHNFFRAENQTDYTLNDRTNIIGGVGLVKEFVRSTRYDNANNIKENTVGYAFTQVEWQPLNRLTLIGGLRYDDNNLYASAISPKLALQYKASEKLRFNASYGRGFKAPDFRQLYLNFTNVAAGSYSVYGTIDAVKIINDLNSKGQIESFEGDFYKLKELKPEYSNGLNAGFHFSPCAKSDISLNIFRNDIKNLIDSRLVAYKQGGAQIYSYINVNKAYTEGAEVNTTYRLNKQFSVSAGCQFLLTADKSDLSEIKSGKVYTRDQNNFSRVLAKSEYFGLPNRSRHTANVRLSYETEKWFANMRVIYNSKWAVNDKDGNGLINKGDEFAQGYMLLNTAAGFNCKSGFGVQGGIDNVLNYADAAYLPNMAGRMFYIQVHYSLTKK